MARALPSGGRIVTLEADPHHGEVARENPARIGMTDQVDLRIGAALDTLPVIEADHVGPFDLVFIDANRPSKPKYLLWALRLTRVGSVINGENVVRDGAIVDSTSADPRVDGVRRFIDMIADEPRLVATAMQTVGSKGWGGFAMAIFIA